MNERLGSWNGKFQDASGNIEQFTVRQADGEGDVNYVMRVKEFKKELEKQGWLSLHASVPFVSANAAPPPKVYSPANPNEPLQHIEVDKIVFGGTGKDGKHPSWRVFGGFAKQFGIVAWPEVIEAAGLKLDPMGENLMPSGTLAYFTSKPKKDDPTRTTPDKVTRIELLGATPDDVFGTDEGVIPF